MIKRNIYVIASSTQEDMVGCKVNALTNIYSCNLQIEKRSTEYTSRFCGAVAEYNNDSVNVGHNMYCQFAMFLLNHAKISNNTFNTILLNLTTLSH